MANFSHGILRPIVRVIFGTIALAAFAACTATDEQSVVLAAPELGQSTQGITLTVGTLPGSVGVDAMGSATYGIPIAISPGVNGIEPSFGLSYNSGGGNGILGVGFSLSGLSSISRCSKNIADDGKPSAATFQQTDAICLDGQRLFLATGTYGASGSTYRTRRDSLAKVELINALSSTSSQFNVYRQNGLIDRYQVGRFHGTAPYEWSRVTTEDRFGNSISYIYSSVIAGIDTTERYLTEARYTQHAAGAWTKKVVFTYSPIGTPTTRYVFGANQVIAKRLTKIESKDSSNVLFASYDLVYEEYGPHGAAAGPRLASVQRCDKDSVCLPQTVFTWQRGNTEFNQYNPVNSPDTWFLYPTSMNEAEYNDDWLWCLDSVLNYENPIISSSCHLGPWPVMLTGDFNGDGKHELLGVEAPLFDPFGIRTARDVESLEDLSPVGQHLERHRSSCVYGFSPG